jgi:hypothetical protein
MPVERSKPSNIEVAPERRRASFLRELLLRRELADISATRRKSIDFQTLPAAATPKGF